MAQIGNICVLIGDGQWNIGDSEHAIPVAVISPDIQTTVLNGTARFDATSSYSDDEDDELRYVWRVTQAPLKSTVKINSVEALVLEDSEDVAYLTVDVVGIYEVELVVIGANGGCSEPATANITATRSTAPLTSQTALDASWIWQMLPDVWTALSDDKGRIETLWRGFAQTAGSDLLNLYNVDANKSIATIQSEVYRRWVSIKPKFELSEKSYIVLHEYKEYEVEVLDQGAPFSSLVRFSTNIEPDLIQSFDGVGIVSGPHEIILQGTPISSDIGDQIVIRVGNREHTYTIGGISYSNNSYLIPSSVIDVPRYPFEIGFTVIPKNDIYLSALVAGASVTPIQYIENLEGRINRNHILKLAEAKVRPAEKKDCILACTLISDDDLEALGIRPGDLLIAEIGNRQFTTTTKVKAKVISVEGNRLAFQLDPTRKWVSDADSLRYATELNLGGVTENLNGTLEITGLSAQIRDIFNTARFRNRYFNRPLSASDTIVFADIAFKIRPLFIIRNTLVPISNEITTFLNLLEYIEIPKLSEDRLTLFGDDNSELELSREPISLVENKDYIIVDPVFTGNNLSGAANSDTVTAERGFFLDRNVEPGDSLFILKGFSRGEYLITGVSQTQLILSPEVPNEFENSTYRIVKKDDTKYLKFLSVFTYTSAAPEILWSETAIVSNNKAIEANFGSIFRLPIEEWERRKIPATYRATIAGLLRSRMLGATVDSMEKSTNILSGLPFIERRCVIREIDYDYLINSVTGVSEITKILVEDLDSTGLETGTLHAHYIKSLTDDVDAEFTGIAINPRTGVRYVVGDEVNENEIISLGIKVRDRYFGPSSNIKGIKSYHTFRVLVNADNTSIDDKGVYYLHDFLMEIKPHYTHVILTFYKYLLDRIDIEDQVRFKLRTTLFDNAHFLNFGAEIFDEFIRGFGQEDQAMEMVRSPRRFLDLTPVAEDTLMSEMGGFLVAIEGTFSDGAMVKVGESQGPDYLILESGKWKGKYEILEVLSDNAIRVSGVTFVEGDGPFKGRIVRPDREVLFTTYTFPVENEEYLETSTGLFAEDIAVGDLVCFPNLAGSVVHTVIDLVWSDEESRYSQVQLFPHLQLTDDFTRTEFVRESSINKIRVAGFDLQVDNLYRCSLEDQGDEVVNVMARRIEPGDNVIVDGIAYPIVGVTTGSLFYTFPLILPGTYSDVSIERSRGSEVLDALDQTVGCIEDVPIFKLRSALSRLRIFEDDPRLFLNANAVLINGIKVGDIIRIVSGIPATIDVGEGPGIFRVLTTPSVIHNSVDVNAYMPANQSDIEYEVWKMPKIRRIYWKDVE